MKIVGITGVAGAGKDTVADHLVARFGYVKVSMAAPLKAGLAAMGWPEPNNRDDKEKLIEGFDFSWRQAAQRLGTEWGRGLDPEVWVKAMALRLRRADDRIVISDIRFENEAKMVRELGGKMLFIAGRAADLGDQATHVSEAGIEFYPACDGLIDNAGKFEDTAAQVAHYLGLKP